MEHQVAKTPMRDLILNFTECIDGGGRVQVEDGFRMATLMVGTETAAAISEILKAHIRTEDNNE